MKAILTLLLAGSLPAFAATTQSGNIQNFGGSGTEPCLSIPASNPDGYFTIKAHAISAGDGYKFYKNGAVNAAGASGSAGYYTPSGGTAAKCSCVCYSSGTVDYGSFVLLNTGTSFVDNSIGAAALVTADATIKWETGLTPSVATYVHPVATTNTNFCERTTFDVANGRIPGIYSLDAHVIVTLTCKEQ